MHTITPMVFSRLRPANPTAASPLTNPTRYNLPPGDHSAAKFEPSWLGMSTGPITPKLVGIAGPLKDSIFSLEQQQFSIGRDPSNELALTDRSVSRRQCVLEKTADGFLMRDLGSLGGTLVNGAVTAQALLQHGDRIPVGNSSFMYVDKAGESPVPSVELHDQAIASGSMLQLPPQEAHYDHPELL